jgi:cysteine synthase A
MLRLPRSQGAQIYLKLESFNPGGSIKDRPALFMIEQAEKDGLLKPGGTIVEPTSGNTGIGIAVVAAVKGYRTLIVMPENMSDERKKLLRAYGAELELTPANQGMPGAIARAGQIVAENHGYFMPQQFENPANARAHMETTAREILEQMDGRVDAVVCGVGSGGTITGLAAALKKQIPGVKIVAVEPAGSPVLAGGTPGPHGIQGIGPGFVPTLLDQTLIDKVIGVVDEDALAEARKMGPSVGLLVGISAGAALWAAQMEAGGMDPDQKIVAIIPDGGEKYMTTSLFE